MGQSGLWQQKKPMLLNYPLDNGFTCVNLPQYGEKLLTIKISEYIIRTICKQGASDYFKIERVKISSFNRKLPSEL